MSSFLLAQQLSKSFQSGEGELEVLRELDLELQKGEMVAITGESGCGKSTLLHLLGGMEKPDGGTIYCEDVDVTALSGAELARFRNRRIGFVFQFHHLLPEFSALENVMLPLLLRRVPFPEARDVSNRLLRDVGLGARGTHKPGELSGGEQQRVAIARALSGNPDLLLGDEPTGNLDEKTSGAIHDLLLAVHERYELTSVIVTHDPSLAALCDYRKSLVDGKLL